MTGYVLSPRAQQDLEEILDYIASDDIAAAERVLSDFERAFERLVIHPEIGRLREDLVQNQKLRFWRVHSYLVVYRKEAGALQIARVLSGFRNLGELLG